MVVATASEPQTLFDGSDIKHWEFREGAWSIDDQGALTCHMEEVKRKDGQVRVRGMGYIWTEKDYDDFELTLQYKISKAANSGVFFRTNPSDPVQSGFEIQLLDDSGFQATKGEIEGKKRNGSFYDCQAPRRHPAKPVGQWNQLKLTCMGPMIRVEINGELVNEVDVNRWDTPRKNPDGSDNKFKTALKQLPRRGRIGFQNHGQPVWFKQIKIQELDSSGRR